MISILMPVYNADKYLEETLDSILVQDYTDWQLIAVNDNSTDKSDTILLKYAAKDRRIKVLLNPEKGIITALRLAYENASGEYITRMDADDIMPKYKLDEMLRILQKNGSGIVATGKVKYFSETTLGDGYKRYEQWLNSLVDEQ
ncbi:MAG: glycosyltransferase family 2 protein, partial [Chitinophagales bacterium]